MIHLYAFADGLRGLPDVAGLDGAPLESRTVDGLEIVVSQRDRGTADGSLRDEAIVHGTVVEALVDRAAAVLPVRFGEEPEDEGTLARLVHERSAVLRRNLARVKGCVEMGVRVATPRESVAASNGTESRHSRRAATAGLDELDAELVPLARQSLIESDTAAYLVPRENLAPVLGAVRRFAASHPQLTLTCTGPWAPYSFTEEPGE